MTDPGRKSWITQREPLTILVLAVLAVIAFTLVSALVRSYQNKREGIARAFFAHGLTAAKAGRFDQAAQDYRAALDESRDDPSYQLELARALAAMDRHDEAYPYLLSLWERQPENGTVNLELARTFARRGDLDQALRYYHNAIYGIWAADADEQRRAARLELIEFLLGRQALNLAEPEILALAATIPDVPDLHLQTAELFVRVRDYQRALGEYDHVLARDNRNKAALAGAGLVSFQLGLYRRAQGYLERAVRMDPQDRESAQKLQIANVVQQLDPFGARLSDPERSRRVLAAFEQAGQRIRDCKERPGDANTMEALQALNKQWLELKHKATMTAMERQPQLRDELMDLAVSLEQKVEPMCVPANDQDQALILIGREREKTEK